jgi:hypothetical protein
MIQSGDDVFQVTFSKELCGHFEVLNINTGFSRKLLRVDRIKGPFRETKAFKWKAEGGLVLTEKIENTLTAALEQAKATNESVAKFVTIRNKDDHLICVEYKNNIQL